MRVLAVLVLAFVSMLRAGSASALGHDSGTLPQCSSPQAIGMLRDRFAFDQGQVWRTGLAISRVLQVSRASSDVRTGLSTRRYCQATVVLNNRSQPTFAYMLELRPGTLFPRFNYCVLVRATGNFAADDCEARKPGSSGSQ